MKRVRTSEVGADRRRFGRPAPGSPRPKADGSVPSASAEAAANKSPARGRVGRAYVIVALAMAGWLVLAAVFFFGHYLVDFVAHLLTTAPD